MPHLDSLSFAHPFTDSGQSRFAAPVAKITAFVREHGGFWRRGSGQGGAPAAPRGRQDLEIRALEDRYAQATDHADLERMQRDYDRRDAGGVGAWDWR